MWYLIACAHARLSRTESLRGSGDFSRLDLSPPCCGPCTTKYFCGPSQSFQSRLQSTFHPAIYGYLRGALVFVVRRILLFRQEVRRKKTLICPTHRDINQNQPERLGQTQWRVAYDWGRRILKKPNPGKITDCVGRQSERPGVIPLVGLLEFRLRTREF